MDINKDSKVKEHIARWLDNYEAVISDVEDEEFASAIREEIIIMSRHLRGNYWCKDCGHDICEC